jgi:hypothetical protein
MVAAAKKAAQPLTQPVLICGPLVEKDIHVRTVVCLDHAGVGEGGEVQIRFAVECGKRGDDKAGAESGGHLLLGRDLIDESGHSQIEIVEFSEDDLFAEGPGVLEIRQPAVESQMIEPDVQPTGQNVTKYRPKRLQQLPEQSFQIFPCFPVHERWVCMSRGGTLRFPAHKPSESKEVEAVPSATSKSAQEFSKNLDRAKVT